LKLKYQVIENGRKLNFLCNSKKEWEKVVTGLNTSMDIVDADYLPITVRRVHDSKIVYRQKRTRVL
jgi:hypothetical protein